jgi:2-polyprenyl-6-methoxyphenol hydroxylase-like FAD-dependent oxidoreductase
MRGIDVAIAGGGPAGALAAICLARAGARVVLATLAEGTARIEGLPPRAAALLDGLGLPPGTVGPAAPRLARWGGREGAANREHPVDRAALDAALRAAAAAAGARLVKARVGRLDGAAGRMATSAGSIAAGVLIEARGRRAPAGPGRVRGPATVAIAGFTGPAAEAAAIEARPGGWVWSAPFAGRRWTQAVTDADRARRDGIAGAWAAVADGPPPVGARARAAELRLNAPELAPGVIAIGDAAVAFDPLSGHGLYWALASALAAPPMARALLDGEAELARRLHRERVAATFWRQARIGRDFHRAAGFGGPFWAARAAWPDDAPAHATVDAPTLRRRAVVRDGRLVEADTLATPLDPDGVAFVAGQPIGPVLARLGSGPLPDLAAFRAQIAPDAPPEAAAVLHGWLASRGFASPRRPAESQQEVTT